MSATADFITSIESAIKPAKPLKCEGSLGRTLQRILGVAMLIMAAALWLNSGAGWGSDVIGFKIFLSSIAAAAGIGLLYVSAEPFKTEIEIDAARREIRLVRHCPAGMSAVAQRCAFADLSKAERNGDTVRLWDKGGAFLAEVTLDDRPSLLNLVSGLRAAGKLA